MHHLDALPRFTGRDAAERVGRFAPHLRLYRDAVQAAELIHLPVLGKIFAMSGWLLRN